MEVDDLLNGGRNAFSSGEVSLNGSINGLSADDEHALSDSELKKMQQSNELANQIKSPSSAVLEKECMSKRLAADIKNEEKKEDDEWVDILGSGDLLKKTVTVGNGRRPENGELVKISFSCLTEDSDEQTIQFVLGYGFVSDAFDIAIPLMNVGEKAQIKSHSRFVNSFDNNDETLEYEIELLEVQSADILDLSYRTGEAREVGNDYYNKRQYEKALRLYDYGIRLLNDADGVIEDIDLRRYTLISNSAACLIKLNEWQKVVELTDDLPFDETLDVDKLILTKIVLRRSDALIKMKKFKDAADSLRLCLGIDPSNTLAKSKLDQVMLQNSKEEKQLKSLYKNMFKALGRDDGNKTGSLQRVKSFLISRRILILALLICFIAIVVHLFRVY